MSVEVRRARGLGGRDLAPVEHALDHRVVFRDALEPAPREEVRARVARVEHDRPPGAHDRRDERAGHAATGRRTRRAEAVEGRVHVLPGGPLRGLGERRAQGRERRAARGGGGG
jgi:hypothetical protein